MTSYVECRQKAQFKEPRNMASFCKVCLVLWNRDGLVLKVTVAGLLSEHNRRWAFLYRTMLDTIAAMSCYRDECSLRWPNHLSDR